MGPQLSRIKKKIQINSKEDFPFFRIAQSDFEDLFVEDGKEAKERRITNECVAMNAGSEEKATFYNLKSTPSLDKIFSSDVLIAIFSFLPMNERFRLRKLSSSFKNLFWHCSRLPLSAVYYTQYKKYFCIEVKSSTNILEKVIFIRRCNHNAEPNLVKKEVEEYCEKYTEIEIYCSTKEEYLHFVLFYFKHFIRNSTYKAEFCLIHIKPAYWKLFTEAVSELPKPFWREMRLTIDVNRLTAEFIAFLDNMHHIRRLCLIIPNTLEYSKRLWLSNGFQTVQFFSIRIKSLNKRAITNQEGSMFNDDFMWIVIKRPGEFISNGINVTEKFLIQYISDCLAGNCIIKELKMEGLNYRRRKKIDMSMVELFIKEVATAYLPEEEFQYILHAEKKKKEISIKIGVESFYLKHKPLQSNRVVQ